MATTDLINYANAIRSIESSGNYGALGPATNSGDRAYGAYQVMGNNIPSWTAKHYGRSLTPQEFLQNKDAQDAVFNGEFGGAVNKYGNPQDAASVWFSGRPMAQAGNSSDGYVTTPEYVQRFNKALGQPSNGVTAINQAMGINNPGSSPALAFSGDDDSEDGTPQPQQGALSQAAPKVQSADDSTGGVLFKGEGPNKLQSLGAMMANAGSAIAGISNPSAGANLRGLAQGIEAQATGQYQYQMGPNGQLVRINKRDGTVDSISIPGAQTGHFQAIMGKDDAGNPVPMGKFDPDTGAYTPFSSGAAAPAAHIGGDPELTGQERYDSLTTNEKKQIDAWRAGTGIQPSQYAMRNPATRKMVDAANAIGIDMTKYGERQAFLKGMASKSPTSAGGQFISAPTVMDHLLNVANDYVTLGNSSGGGYSSLASAANFVKDMRGGTARQAQQTSADRNSDTASKEIVSFLTRGHGGVTERQDTHDKLYMPTAAPEVQAAALEAYRKQVADRFYELADGAKGSVGEDNPELLKAAAAFKAKDEALQNAIQQIKTGKKAPAANSPAAPAPAPGGVNQDALQAEMKRRGLL